MQLTRPFAFALILCCLTTSCANHRGPPVRSPPFGAGSGLRTNLVFISPMGEPFRVAEANESALDAWFSAADADQDQALSEDEFLGDARAFFARLDANRDAVATSPESTTLWRREAPEMLASGGGGPIGVPGRPTGGNPPRGGPAPRDNPSGGRPAPSEGRREAGPATGFGGETGPALQGAQRFGLLGDIEPVMSCDTDFSRFVTQAEFETCATQRFQRLDEDHNGRFARAEARLWRDRSRRRD